MVVLAFSESRSIGMLVEGKVQEAHIADSSNAAVHCGPPYDAHSFAAITPFCSSSTIPVRHHLPVSVQPSPFTAISILFPRVDGMVVQGPSRSTFEACEGVVRALSVPRPAPVLQDGAKRSIS